jgi:prophage tail gpP-like protein/phage tail protein X
MARPEQGQLYTVKQNDTIHTIERSAYGRVVNRVIQANYDLLKNRGISDEGLPILYAGDVLFIPIYKNRYFDQPITADFDTQLLVKLNGIELPGALAGRISRAMNRIASGFVFDVPFDITSREELDLFRPYTYHTAQLYIGGELYITAVASNWTYSASSDGTIATIECRTTPGEMLECMGMRSSYTFRAGMSLLKICQEVASPYGITCYSASGTGGVVEGESDITSEQFGRVEQDITETDAAFLERLALAKGFLLTSRPDGNLLLTRANTKDAPAFRLVYGEAPVLSIGASFDGTKRYRKWMGVTDEEGVSSISATLYDKSVPRERGFVFKADESDEGNIEQAIKWRMSKSIAESAAIPVQVVGWRTPDGELWTENMKGTITAPDVFILRETPVIIESVELTKDAGGDIASLMVVLPESYTTTMPKQPYPWEGMPK